MQPILNQLRPGFFLSIFLLVMMAPANAQTTKKLSKLYLEGGFGGGSYESFESELGARAVFNNKWSLSMAYMYSEMTPKNEPGDYQPETGVILIIPYTYSVTTEMSFLNLTAGRCFKLSRSVWSTMEAGLSYVQGDKISYQKQEVFPSILITNSNYATHKEAVNGLGLVLQADINWAFCPFAGLGVGVYSNLNTIQSPVGINLKLIVGKMGRDKKHREK